MSFRLWLGLAAMLAGCSAAGQVETVSSGSSGGAGVGLTTSVGQPFNAASTSGGVAGSSSGGSTTGAATTGGSACPGGDLACGSTCCPGGWSCIDGACCEAPCNGVCCPTNDACATLGGVPQCAQLCQDSARCPSGAPCCSPQGDGGGVCVAGDETTQACLCTNSVSCGVTACCAPETDASGNPSGPYICKVNDAAHYDCCNGAFNTCGGADCCVTDGYGNEFCATPCSDSSTCGAAACENFSFSSSLICSGPTACGPPG